MSTDKSLLDRIGIFLKDYVTPYSEQLDHDSDLMRQTFIEFKQQQLFSYYIPSQWGGFDLSTAEKITIQELFGMHGGALAFLQAQTATASWLLQQSDNTQLKNTLLTQVATGERTLGNCTYQMKPNHPGQLFGTKVKSGYRLSGKLNMTSGYRLFDDLVLGFHSDNTELFAVIPYATTSDNSLMASNAISSISMTSINTVSLSFDQYFIPDDCIIIESPIHSFFQQYRLFPPFAFPIGIAKQAMQLTSQAKILARPSLKQQHESIQSELEQLKQEIISLACLSHKTSQKIDSAFARMAKITLEAVNFAIFLSGGAGLVSSSPIQRLYRELVVWLIPRAFPEVIENLFETEQA